VFRFSFFAGFKQDSPGFLGDPQGYPRQQSKIWKAKSTHYLKQTYEHILLMIALPNTAVQPIRVLWRRNKHLKSQSLNPQHVTI
jgi:hypothetical protein